MTNFNEPEELLVFRQTVRRFIADNLPPVVREKVRRGVLLTRRELELWERQLVDKGWYVPHWPERWGGQDMSPPWRMTLDEELAQNDCPEGNAFGPEMVGPMLMQFGDDAQKEFFLPRITNLAHQWCQGYSEPNAGSDLASLQTRALREGDDYIVNGSKIWTSSAHYADWMFALVRTGADSKPQEGISFLLIDMRSPGITIKPIIGIHGWHLFNQVFLDDVRVPVANRVGQENMGWTIAKSVLEHERLKLSRVPECHRRLARLKALSNALKERGQPIAQRDWFKLKLAGLEVRLMALEASVLRFRQQALAGGRLGAETGRLKLRGSQLVQAFENLTVDVAGPLSLPYDPAAHHELVDDAPRPWNVATTSARRFMSRGFTIAGGSSEIQHNQLAKQVLGL